ncbi:NifB/NifX family molybdenum-iron cluster-binding protein, partial [Salinispira pacifica]
MKVIVSISGDNIESRFDPRFGRAAAFCLFDSASSESSIHDNPGLDATGGAGIVAAQFVAELGAQAVVSGAFGPNAFDTLEAAGVAMYAGPTDRAIT